MAEKLFWHLPQKIVGQSKLSWIFYEVACSLAYPNDLTKYLLKLHPSFGFRICRKYIFLCRYAYKDSQMYEFIIIFAPLRILLI